jgi:hypothetical protein
MEYIMNIARRIYPLLGCLALLCAAACGDHNVTEFGFDGSFAGTLRDEAGNIVPGNITSGALVVKALGEGDEVTTDMRVKGDGTYQNTKLYPKKYKIWVTGPVTPVTDTAIVDFAKQKNVKQDLVVTPFISIGKPGVSGNPSSTSVDISFEMTANSGKVVSKRELYCSTNPFPDASTGSGAFYDTKKLGLNANEGTVSVSELAPQTKYYVRIGAQANGTSAFNYSEQIEIQTP